MREEAVGEEKTKRATKSKELYLSRNFGSMDHLFRTIANFRAWLIQKVRNYNPSKPPLLVKYLEEYIDAFSGSRAQTWMTKVDLQHFAISLAIEIQEVIGCFVRIARSRGAKAALENNALTDPSIFRAATSAHITLLDKIQETVNSGHLCKFMKCPPVAPYVSGAYGPAPSEGISKRSSSAGNSDSNTPKKQKKGKKGHEKKKKNNEEMKKKGLFEYTGTNAHVPKPDFK